MKKIDILLKSDVMSEKPLRHRLVEKLNNIETTFRSIG